MRDIAIKRLRILPLAKGEGLETKKRIVALAELAQLGVRPKNPEALRKASSAFFLSYPELIATLTKMRGGDVEYVPLFVDFPSQVPDDDAYFAKRIIGYLGNALSLWPEGERTEEGTVIPEWLFDLREFGADPVTQMQSTSLWTRAKERIAARKKDTRTEWLDVEFVWEDEVLGRLQAWLEHCFYAKSSIKEALHEDLRTLLSHLGPSGLDFERIAMKENQALYLRMLWNGGHAQDACLLARTPTDMLRLFAALTDSDVSLAAPITYPKLSRAQRRYVLASLERAPALQEDLQRYRGLWLALGRSLHPGEHRRRYPKVADAFRALRNDTIVTFNSTTESLLRKGEASAVLEHLRQRPGVMARKLHELLRTFPSESVSICACFAEIAESMSIKHLLILRSYFETINEDQHRTVINKRGKIKVLANRTRGALSAETLETVASSIASALRRSLRSRERWTGSQVWIDPRLCGYTVPLAQRAASDGLLTVGRGTRIALDEGAVLRLFVYWKQSSMRTDLDLSVIQFADDWSYAGHVSYTNLSESGVAHSGDVQSAPHGAAEFIDITLSKIEPGVRYVAAQVFRYCGETFADMTCHSGWMIRDKVDASRASFDIKTVQNKFDLKGRDGYCVPLVLDLKTREIIITDLYMGSKSFHNNVEGAFSNVAIATREVARFTATRPTMYELARTHVEARGGQLGEKAAAAITFGVEGCTYNATEVEHMLSELL